MILSLLFQEQHPQVAILSRSRWAAMASCLCLWGVGREISVVSMAVPKLDLPVGRQVHNPVCQLSDFRQATARL